MASLRQSTGSSLHVLRQMVFRSAELLLFAYAQLIGLQSMADTSPVIHQILQEPGMDLFIVDVPRALSEGIARVIKGVYVENTRVRWQKSN